MTLFTQSGWWRYGPVALILLVGLGVSGALGWRLHLQAVQLDEKRLDRIVKVVLDGLNSRLQTTDLILRSGEDYFGSQEVITAAMFREWCMKYGWSITAPWLHGVAFYTNQNAGAWRDWVPRDSEQSAEEEFLKMARKPLYTSVDLKYAFGYCSDRSKSWPAGFAGQVWYEYLASARRGEPFAEIFLAIVANTPHSTTRQVVINTTNGPAYGAAVAVPVYATDRNELLTPLGDAPQRKLEHHLNWNLCRGVLFGPIDYSILESQIWGDGSREVGVEIFTSSAPSADQWLNPAEHPPHALDPQFKPLLKRTIPWKVYTRDWSIFVYTKQPFEDGSPRYMADYMAYLTFGSGVGITLLAATLIGVSLRARTHQERMTAEVIEARDALAAAEKEREKLSHDLHDGAIQSLYAMQLGLGRMAQNLSDENGNVRQELSVARAELDAIIAEIRRFISEQAGAQAVVDFAAVLRALVQRTHAGTTAEIQASCEPEASERLSDVQAVQLANIAREALSNSLRHGQPGRVEIRLRAEPEAVCLEISDDGAGFAPDSTAGQGVGMTSMARRAEEMRGTFAVQSAPGRGTRIVIRVPMPGRGTPPALKETHREST